jgi:AcrR family transcriptional regulator
VAASDPPPRPEPPAGPAERPPRGRQAEARRNDLAVLEAARDVFASQGFDAPVSAVAKRAGVGMGSLYRRYGSKTELLQRLCVLAMEQSLAAAMAALAAEDAWAGLAGYVRECVELRSGALAGLAGHIPVTAEMDRVARAGQETIRALVSRAQRAGLVRADLSPLDLAWLVEQFSRRVPEPYDPDDDRAVRARLLTIALDGLRAGAAITALPQPPPNPGSYAGRWRAPGNADG